MGKILQIIIDRVLVKVHSDRGRQSQDRPSECVLFTGFTGRFYDPTTLAENELYFIMLGFFFWSLLLIQANCSLMAL